MAKTETPAEPVAKFSKQQILAAKKYAERRDLLSVLLAEDKSYELAEVDKLINAFLKKEFDKPKVKEGD
ncbi:MAG: hypothetical protein K0R22_12 [Sporomusa sp.]|nr:hypothetical protein [Sporomusa sp.]